MFAGGEHISCFVETKYWRYKIMDNLDNEVLAVIAAALENNLKREGINLFVKSIKRVPNNRPIWSTTGKLERLSRRMNT
jgi:hypothetical protein